MQFAGLFGSKVEQRTLSCQTDIELIKFLLKLHANLLEEGVNPAPDSVPSVDDYDLPTWATLSATALLQTMRTRIREESVSEDGNSDSGQLKKITIQLDANSSASSSARSHLSSPASWSPTTIWRDSSDCSEWFSTRTDLDKSSSSSDWFSTNSELSENEVDL